MLRALTRSRAPALADSDAPTAELSRIDASRFAVLYERHFPQVYRYLYAHCRDRHQAEDLAQDVFLNAYRALGRFRGNQQSFAAWILRIARNAATDAHRRRKPNVPLGDIEVLAGRSAEPDAAIEQREALHRLQLLVSGLDAFQQDLLALRFGAGLTSREIAAVVGKSESAVKKQLARTIHYLKENHRD